MKFLPKAFIAVFFLFANIFCFAQNDNPMVGIGKWRIHLPYYDGAVVAEGNGKIYCATRYGFFAYNTGDQSIERFSRVTHLSDLEISTIRYSPEDHLLLVAYANANIDLVYDDGTVINLPGMKLKNIIGGKSINHIYFLNHYAYLSCSFGIVVVNLAKKEVKDTYHPGIDSNDNSVYSVTYYNSKLYAATQTGIFTGDINDQFLGSFTQWTRDITAPAFSKPYTSIATLSNKIFAIYNDTTKYQFDGTSWSLFQNDNFNKSKFDVYNNHLTLTNYFSISIFDQSLTRVEYLYNTVYPNANPVNALMGNGNIVWIADGTNGLVKYQGGQYEFIQPNSPAGLGAGAMDSGKDGIWVASSNLVGTNCSSYPPKGAYLFNNNFWKSFYGSNDSIYRALGNPCVFNIAVDPKDGKHAFAGTRNHGLLEYRDNGIVKVYNRFNSTLKPIGLYTTDDVWVSGSDYDQDGNLWVVSGPNAQSLNRLAPDGTWSPFSIGTAYAYAYIFGLLVDSYNQKWINLSGTGLVAFNENDANNPNDESIKILVNQPGNGNLPSLAIRAMVLDHDGAIWLGTDLGVAVIYNPGSVFTKGANYDAQQILIQQDGHNQYLLATEDVFCIAVDGANRKWFGTLNSGVYLMSADGTKAIYHFDSENSPLLSNWVQSIAIDPVSGEVFFGTDKGICSYRGDATEGGDACDNYYVFPNPVKHEYRGPIAIKGLIKDASVKIADVSGQLVYQTKANGGQAIWNGNNFNGQRAQTGVYIVYVTNDDGSATCVTKMLFTN